MKPVPGVLQRGALADTSANPERGTHLPSPPSPSAARQVGRLSRLGPRLCDRYHAVGGRPIESERVEGPPSAPPPNAPERFSRAARGGGGLGPPRTLWLARLMEAGLTSIQTGVGCAGVAICACALPSYLRRVLGLQVFSYLPGAQLSRGDLRNTHLRPMVTVRPGPPGHDRLPPGHIHPPLLRVPAARSHRLFSMFQTRLSTAAPGI